MLNFNSLLKSLVKILWLETFTLLNHIWRVVSTPSTLRITNSNILISFIKTHNLDTNNIAALPIYLKQVETFQQGRINSPTIGLCINLMSLFRFSIKHKWQSKMMDRSWCQQTSTIWNRWIQTILKICISLIWMTRWRTTQMNRMVPSNTKIGKSTLTSTTLKIMDTQMICIIKEKANLKIN